jgi:HEAT repeat protein
LKPASELSNNLAYSLQKYGIDVVDLLIFLITCENIKAEMAAEILRWLGRTDHPEIYRERLWLLERSLKCSSATVRDAGVLGLASLDDPHAIPYLKRAIKKEKNLELRQHMERVLAQLERLR